MRVFVHKQMLSKFCFLERTAAIVPVRGAGVNYDNAHFLERTPLLVGLFEFLGRSDNLGLNLCPNLLFDVFHDGRVFR